MNNYKIVIIDRERVMLKLSEKLEGEGFLISTSYPDEKIPVATASMNKLVRFDILLSQDSMGSAFQRIHSFPTPPLLLFTARVDSTDHLFKLEIGVRNIIDKLLPTATAGDRYKPVSNSGLSFRDEKLVAGPILIDSRTLQVLVSGTDICLTPMEFNLLRFLASNPEKVFNRKELMTLLYGPDVEDRPRTVDCHIAHIRKKISRHLDQNVIRTIYGRGYTFRISEINETGSVQ